MRKRLSPCLMMANLALSFFAPRFAGAAKARIITSELTLSISNLTKSRILTEYRLNAPLKVNRDKHDIWRASAKRPAITNFISMTKERPVLNLRLEKGLSLKIDFGWFRYETIPNYIAFDEMAKSTLTIYQHDPSNWPPGVRLCRNRMFIGGGIPRNLTDTAWIPGLYLVVGIIF